MTASFFYPSAQHGKIYHHVFLFTLFFFFFTYFFFYHLLRELALLLLPLDTNPRAVLRKTMPAK